jgi:riboflavin biosynthesis pyrimidine reductase
MLTSVELLARLVGAVRPFPLGRDHERRRTLVGQAREAAQGRDVRLGGGATTIRQFVDAGLVDTLHVVVSDEKLGSGSRLWESPEDLRDQFHLDVVPSPSGVTHHLFWRK